MDRGARHAINLYYAINTRRCSIESAWTHDAGRLLDWPDEYYNTGGGLDARLLGPVDSDVLGVRTEAKQGAYGPFPVLADDPAWGISKVNLRGAAAPSLDKQPCSYTMIST